MNPIVRFAPSLSLALLVACDGGGAMPDATPTVDSANPVDSGGSVDSSIPVDAGSPDAMPVVTASSLFFLDAKSATDGDIGLWEYPLPAGPAALVWDEVDHNVRQAGFVAGKLYFVNRNANDVLGVWVYDPTQAKVAGENPREFYAPEAVDLVLWPEGDRLYISIYSNSFLGETAVFDTSAPVDASNPAVVLPMVLDDLQRLGNQLFLIAYDPSLGRELFAYDPGAPTGPANPMAFDLNPGGGGSNPVGLAVVDDTLYFATNTPTTGAELFRYDPSTPAVAPAPVFDHATDTFAQAAFGFDDKVFYIGDAGDAVTTGYSELCVFDPALPGSVTNPRSLDLQAGSSAPSLTEAVVAGDRIVMPYSQGGFGRELAVFDPAAAVSGGNPQIIDLDPADSSAPRELVTDGTKAYFLAHLNATDADLLVRYDVSQPTVLGNNPEAVLQAVNEFRGLVIGTWTP